MQAADSQEDVRRLGAELRAFLDAPAFASPGADLPNLPETVLSGWRSTLGHGPITDLRNAFKEDANAHDTMTLLLDHLRRFRVPPHVVENVFRLAQHLGLCEKLDFSGLDLSHARLMDVILGHDVSVQGARFRASHMRPEGFSSWNSNSIQSISWSPDSDRIASCGYDPAVRLWSPSRSRCERLLVHRQSPVYAVAYAPTGKEVLAVRWKEHAIQKWNIAAMKITQVLQNPEGGGELFRCAAYTPRADRILSGSFGGYVRVWDAETGECIHVTRNKGEDVWCVASTPDGRAFVSCGSECVRWWDTAGGECVRILEGHKAVVDSVGFSPDGMLLASGSRDGEVRLWNAHTGAFIASLTGHTDTVSLSFSPSGVLATGSHDGTLRLWDTTRFECLRVLDAGQQVTCAAFAPDGTRLAWCGWKGFIRVLRMADDSMTDLPFRAGLMVSGADMREVTWTVEEPGLLEILRANGARIE